MNRELRQAGRHSYYLDEDTFFLILNGAIDLSEVIAIHDQLAQILKEHGRLFVIVDGRNGNGATRSEPEVRRYIAEWNRRHRASGVAAFGQHGPITSAFMALIFAAIRLFRKETLPLALVKDESEARAWVAAERARLKSAASRGS